MSHLDEILQTFYAVVRKRPCREHIEVWVHERDADMFRKMCARIAYYDRRHRIRKVRWMLKTNRVKLPQKSPVKMKTPHSPTGIEALVCRDISDRQAKGISKYGVTVADNPLSLRQWLQHAYE